jgi:hypothetical protein
MKKLILLPLMIISLFACKDPEEENLCTNGFLDPGEETIDCDGDCDPCAVEYNEYVSFRYNNNAFIMQDTIIAFNTKSLTKTNNSWSLSSSNDSIYLFLKHTSDGSTGYYSLDPTSKIEVNGQIYDMYSSDVFSISDNNSGDSRLSGYFESKFLKLGSNDTIHVKSGTYTDMKY